MVMTYINGLTHGVDAEVRRGSSWKRRKGAKVGPDWSQSVFKESGAVIPGVDLTPRGPPMLVSKRMQGTLDLFVRGIEWTDGAPCLEKAF